MGFMNKKPQIREAELVFLSKSFPEMRKCFFDDSLFVPRKQKKSWRKFLVKNALNVGMVLGLATLVGYFVPQGVAMIFPDLTVNLIRANEVNEEKVDKIQIEQIVLDSVPNTQEENSESKKIKPRYNLNAPAGQWLQIDAIGIEAEILTNDDISKADEVKKILDQGIYAYPGKNMYGDDKQMVILAGHHYNMFTSKKQDSETFQKLDQAQVGDRVIITDDQKQWTYEVYKVEKSAQIDEPTADLVMYTCVFWWDDDLRLFVYANLVDE